MTHPGQCPPPAQQEGGRGGEAGWSASRRAAARSCTQRHQQAVAARAAAAPPPLQGAAPSALRPHDASMLPSPSWGWGRGLWSPRGAVGGCKLARPGCSPAAPQFCSPSSDRAARLAVHVVATLPSTHPSRALAFSATTRRRPLRRPADAGRKAARVRGVCLPLPTARPPMAERCCTRLCCMVDGSLAEAEVLARVGGAEKWAVRGHRASSTLFWWRARWGGRPRIRRLHGPLRPPPAPSFQVGL